jgi:hypothetical protein
MVGDYWRCPSHVPEVDDLWILILGLIAKRQSNWEVNLAGNASIYFTQLSLRHILPHFMIIIYRFLFLRTTVSESVCALSRQLSMASSVDLSPWCDTITWTRSLLAATYASITTKLVFGQLLHCDIRLWIVSICLLSRQ